MKQHPGVSDMEAAAALSLLGAASYVPSSLSSHPNPLSFKSHDHPTSNCHGNANCEKRKLQAHANDEEREEVRVRVRAVKKQKDSSSSSFTAVPSSLLSSSSLWLSDSSSLAKDQNHVSAIGGEKEKKLESESLPVKENNAIEINLNDVLCGRGGETNQHPGNVYYRTLVKARQVAYLQARRSDKPRIAASVVKIIREVGGRFLKRYGGCWVDVGDKKAREKTSQALRENAPEIRERQNVAIHLASVSVPPAPSVKADCHVEREGKELADTVKSNRLYSEMYNGVDKLLAGAQILSEEHHNQVDPLFKDLLGAKTFNMAQDFHDRFRKQVNKDKLMKEKMPFTNKVSREPPKIVNHFDEKVVEQEHAAVEFLRTPGSSESKMTFLDGLVSLPSFQRETSHVVSESSYSSCSGEESDVEKSFSSRELALPPFEAFHTPSVPTEFSSLPGSAFTESTNAGTSLSVSPRKKTQEALSVCKSESLRGPRLKLLKRRSSVVNERLS